MLQFTVLSSVLQEKPMSSGVVRQYSVAALEGKHRVYVGATTLVSLKRAGMIRPSDFAMNEWKYRSPMSEFSLPENWQTFLSQLIRH